MVSYLCQNCNYQTHIKCNYDKHLKTQKHLKKVSHTDKNVEKCGQNVEKKCILSTEEKQSNAFFLEKSPQNICQLCCKVFSRSDSLKRHLSLCKLNNKQKMELKYPEVSKNVEKKCISQNFKCQFCQNEYKSNRGLSKHIKN